MSSSGVRATRSRFSSPAQQQPSAQQDEGFNGNGHVGVEEERKVDNSNAVASNKQQSIRQWLEPSVEHKASSEQAGFAKAGVLGGMAALGELPKPPRKNGDGHPKTRIILRHTRDSGIASPGSAASPAPRTPDVTGAAPRLDAGPVPAAASHTGISTPEPPRHSFSNPPSSNFSAAPAPADAPARKALPTNEDADDEDYDPKQGNRRKSMPKPAAPKRGRPPSTMRRSSMPPAKPSPVKQMRPETPPAIQAPPSGQHAQPAPMVQTTQTAQPVQAVAIVPPVAPPEYEPRGTGYAEMVVEAAVDEALIHNRFPTAWALRTLYDANAGDPTFVLMVERVFSQTADAETLKEFGRLLKEKKREGKKDNTGREYFVPPDPTDHELRLPKPGPYGRFLYRNTSAAAAIAAAPAPAHVPAPAQEPAPAVTTHAEQDEGEARASKKLKLTHRNQEKTPRKMADTPGANGSKTPGSRKRARQHSDSSLSSLEGLESPELPETSALAPAPTMDEIAQPSFKGEAGKTKATKSREAKVPPGAGPQSPSQPGSRPMNTRRKPTKPQQFVSDAFASNSESPTTSLSPSRDLPPSTNFKPTASMPGRIPTAAEKKLFAKNKTANSTPTAATQSPAASDELNEVTERRRGARKVTTGYHALDSSVRDEDGGRETTPMRSTRKTRQSVGQTASTRATRSAKRANDGFERYDSPGVFTYSAQEDGSSVVGSRAVTPTNLQAAKKRTHGGMRIKSSPVKKKGGTAAGMPRTMFDAQSFVSNGPNREQADNDEYCSACGNSGDVVCCDGCPRSFHFECVDMIQAQASDLPEDWYCNECVVKRWPSRVPVHKGVFGGPLNQLEKGIPRAFSLPKRVQTRFEGVRAGADGDYEEITATKVNTRRTNNKGYEDNVDFYKQRDDGDAVLCHACQRAADENRPIISCSACPLYWHIDCLDPPLAVPPPVKTWKCPAHNDDLLLERPPLAPAHRYRKIKGAQLVTPAISRGLKNNGHVEIDWGSEPEEDDNSGWKDMASFGRTYKISAKGVRLDFIEQLRKQGGGRASSKESLSREEPYLTPPVEDTIHRAPGPGGEERNVEEMQASLVLASLKQSAPSALDHLVSALLASASPSIISLIARGDATNIARDTLGNQDKNSLRALLEEVQSMGGRIRELLGDDTEATAKPDTPEEPELPHEKAISADKTDSEPLVTEPTPPSTIDHEGAMDFE